MESGLNSYLTLQFLTRVLYYWGNSFMPKSLGCWSQIAQGKVLTLPHAGSDLQHVIEPGELRVIHP